MRLFKKYKNGNYIVHMYDDGTKIREMEGIMNPDPEFPENIDIKITNKCDIGCKYCYENSIANTTESWDIINTDMLTLIDSLTPGTEVALGGGALSTTLRDGNLTLLLAKLKVAGIITNCTFNQLELPCKLYVDEQHEVSVTLAEFLDIGLLHYGYINGVGLSFKHRNDKLLEELIKKYPNRIVVHVINGIATREDYEYLKKLNCKILILGYKDFGRGDTYLELIKPIIEKNQKETEENILNYMKSFRSVSFDTLALEQLNIKDKVSAEVWNRNYLGDDGRYTMYIDMVERKYAKNSIQLEENRHKLPETKSINIKQLFKTIKEES